MNLQEVIKNIQETEYGNTFDYEKAANNHKPTKHYDTFEAVLINNKEKYLIPETSTLLHFLYRGQNYEVVPCVPSIYRGEPSVADIFLERMRLTVFRRMLQSHPIVKYFFNRHHFIVDEEGLAQHYGLKTSVLDLTSNLDVALFFATCKYDSVTDSYQYYDDNNEHTAILYVFDPIYDNEPTPPVSFKSYMRGNIRPIGLQAFPRPGVQGGYALHIPQGESTKSWIYRFTFTSDDSKYYYNKFNKGKSLWVQDRVVPITKKIASQTAFSFDVFNETYECYRPKGYSKTKLKKEISQKLPCICLLKHVPDVVFSQKEQQEIIDEWNGYLGKDVCEKIVSKNWFHFESQEKDTGKICGKHDNSMYMTLDHLNDFITIRFESFPTTLKNAEFCNYKGTPRPPQKVPSNNGKWEKVEASMNAVFGKPWMTEEDWLIKV